MEKNFKHDSDGSNSPFSNNQRCPRNHIEEQNVPLDQMISDIVNKRGISKLEEMKAEELRKTMFDLAQTGKLNKNYIGKGKVDVFAE
jgi:hypothetical protein